jgi:hypothetical protein
VGWKMKSSGSSLPVVGPGGHRHPESFPDPLDGVFSGGVELNDGLVAGSRCLPAGSRCLVRCLTLRLDGFKDDGEYLVVMPVVD